jgi:hypothetical protein
MHPACEESTSTLDATVEELMPKLGLAFVMDGATRSWGVTRSTPGCRFEALAPGRRVRVLVQFGSAFSVVRECRLVD